MTKHAEEKRGMVLALSLPEKDVSDVRTKVFEGLGLEKLRGEIGFKNLIEFLDKEFWEDKIYDVFNAFEEFESVKKEHGQTMQQYISDFEQRYRRARNKGFPDLPQEYLMFKIIKNAGLSETEVRIVQTDIDYDEKSKLLESAKAGLVKYFRRSVKAGNKSDLKKSFALDRKVKEEDDVNVTNDYRNRSGTFPKGNGGGFRRGSGRGGFQNRNAGGYGGKVGFGGNRGGNQGQWNGGNTGYQRTNGGGGNGGREGGNGARRGGNGGRNNFGNQQNGGNSGNKKQKPLNPVDQNGDPQL